MNQSTERTNAPGHLAINGEFTIYTAADWRERLLNAVVGQSDVELDLSEVSEIDTAGLQLLLATRREVRAAGGSLHLAAPSPAVVDVLNFCGLADDFGLAVASTVGEPS